VGSFIHSQWIYSALGGVKIVSNSNKGNSKTRDKKSVCEGMDGIWGVSWCSEKKGNTQLHSLHINILLTSAGSTVAWQCSYAFIAWNLK